MLKSKPRIGMSSEYMPHFVENTKTIFKTILDWDIKIISRDQGKEFRAGHDISGIMGFAGAVQGTIVLSIDKQVGFEATKAFTGEWPASINGDVRDMVAELANMIGLAKRLLKNMEANYNLDKLSRKGWKRSFACRFHTRSFDSFATAAMSAWTKCS